MYSIFIHDNQFVSNDLFVSSGRQVNMTVRIENNRFMLTDESLLTEGRKDFRNIGASFEEQIKTEGNVFGGKIRN